MGFFDVESPGSGTLEVAAKFTTRDDNTWLDGEHARTLSHTDLDGEKMPILTHFVTIPYGW